MRGSSSSAVYVCGAAILLGLSSTGARAQIADANWRYSITPYAWLTGLSGTVGVGPLASNVDLSAGDVLKHLQFGLMGSGEAHKGSWMFAADGIYAKLGANDVIALRGDTGSLSLTQRETIIQPVGGYSIGGETWGLDFLGGMRYWNLGTTIDVDRARPTNPHSASRQWLDATGGLRVHWDPLEKLSVVAAGDGGGGGSHSTWQAYGSLRYDAWEKWALGASYRVLAVDYDHDNFLYDTRMKGFVLGATYRTW